MKKEKSFTIIELLVVIAIIGLLASIVLVSTQGARQRAIIGKSIAFSGHVQRSLGAYAVAFYNFNDGTAADSSGNNNNGTILPGGVTSVSGITELGKALHFDGASGYVDIGSSASLNITDKITIELWIKPEELNRRQRLINKGAQYYLNFWETNRIYTHLRRSDGTWFEGHVSTKTWGTDDLNKFFHIAMTWDGNDVKGYINGAYETGFAALASPLTVTSNNVYIGSVGPAEIFKGAIDEVRIYNQSLSLSEIQKHYAEGTLKHGIVLNK